MGEPRRRGAPGTITREQILDTAEDIARREGLEAVTLRRLSSALGVTAAALYWHIDDKQHLVGLLVDRASARTERPGPEFGNWYERLVRLYLSTREQFTAYKGLSAALVTSEPTASTLSNCLHVIECLNEAGFDETAAFEVFDTLSTLSFGHLMMIDTTRFERRHGREEALVAYAIRVRELLETNADYAAFVRRLIDFDESRSRAQLIRGIELVVHAAAAEAGIPVPLSPRVAAMAR